MRGGLGRRRGAARKPVVDAADLIVVCNAAIEGQRLAPTIARGSDIVVRCVDVAEALDTVGRPERVVDLPK